MLKKTKVSSLSRPIFRSFKVEFFFNKLPEIHLLFLRLSVVCRLNILAMAFCIPEPDETAHFYRTQSNSLIHNAALHGLFLPN